MTKIKLDNYNPVPVKDLTKEYLTISPYFRIALQIMYRRGIANWNGADLFETFHEIAKLDNKINKRKK